MPSQATSGAASSAALTMNVSLDSGAEAQVFSSRKLNIGEEVLLFRSTDGGTTFTQRDYSAGADGVLLNKDKASNSFRGPGFFQVQWAITTEGDRILYIDT